MGFTTMFQPGDIWIADMPFAQGTGSKSRPVLVLWVDLQDAVVAIITTAAPRTASDVVLADWAAAGLLRQSTVRLKRLGAVEGSRLSTQIGRVSKKDAKRLNAAWAKHLKLRL